MSNSTYLRRSVSMSKPHWRVPCYDRTIMMLRGGGLPVRAHVQPTSATPWLNPVPWRIVHAWASNNLKGLQEVITACCHNESDISWPFWCKTMKLMTHVELNYLDYDFRFIVWNKWINSHGEKLKFYFADCIFQHIFYLVLNQECLLKLVAALPNIFTVGNY